MTHGGFSRTGDIGLMMDEARPFRTSSEPPKKDAHDPE